MCLDALLHDRLQRRLERSNTTFTLYTGLALQQRKQLKVIEAYNLNLCGSFDSNSVGQAT